MFTLHACKTSKLLVTLHQNIHSTTLSKKKEKYIKTLSDLAGKGVLHKIIVLKAYSIFDTNEILLLKQILQQIRFM